MTDNQTIAALRNVELKNNNASKVDVNDSEPLQETNESCWERFTWWMNDNIAFQSIISCLSASLTNCYDILTILISVADVTTDAWVIYNFKIGKRNTFFIIALIVMVFAQCSYAMAFMLRFKVPDTSKKSSCGYRLTVFLLILPLTPFMSFIFYWCTEFPQNGFIRLLEKYFDIEDRIDIQHGFSNTNQPKLMIWIKKKAKKHMGFILEAMIEALPQSIIQLIAIVYYQDTQLINIASICISLLSVATKTMVFSVAIDFRAFIFNWLSLVCDFFGVFAVVVWYVAFNNLVVFLSFCNNNNDNTKQGVL